jgi:glc operon protein GlcG
MELPSRKMLTIEAAKTAAEAAKTYARSKGCPTLIVVVVDPGGHLVYLERGDGVAWGTIDVAMLKAQTAVRFPGPSKKMETALIKEGMTGLVGLPGVACFEGAVPLLAEDGHLLGAISISGLTKELDGEIAQAGADALLKLLEDARPEKAKAG